jgi:chemotaxis signal transduction protein
MKASVLEFKLFEDTFCFNTEHIEYVFELESYQELKGFHDSVVGVTRYNEDVIPLIDTAKLYSNKSLDLEREHSVVVIRDEKQSLYGMIVDEIIKLEELESVSASLNLNSDDLVINHYKEKEGGDIVNEIHPLPLLKKYAIAAMATVQERSEAEEELNGQESTNYLLFKIAQHSYAVASHFIKEVLENDLEVFELENATDKIKGAIAVRDEVIPLAKLVESPNANDIVVMELGDKKVAIVVDEVYDIENFSDRKVEKLATAKSAVTAFYNHNGDVVAIIDPHFYIDEKQDKVLSKESETAEVLQAKDDYLIFMLDETKYSINMESVRHVLETDSLVKTQSSSMVTNSNIEFIATWNGHAINILNMKNLLKLEGENSSQTIIIESGGHLVAFMVQDIDNIVYLKRSEVSSMNTDGKSLIDGAIVYNSEVIVKLSEAYLASMA